MLLLLILPTSNGSTKRPYKVMYTNANSTYHKGRYRSLVHLLTISLSVFWPANLGCRLLYLQSLVTINESSGSAVLLCRTQCNIFQYDRLIAGLDQVFRRSGCWTILYLHHTQWPSRSMCWSLQRINSGHTTVIPRRTLTGSVRLKSFRVFQPNETTGCPPCAHERPAYTNHPKMCTIPLSAFYYRSTHLWSNHWITIYHRIYYSSIWQGCKLQKQVTTFIQLEDKPVMELPPNIASKSPWNRTRPLAVLLL